MSVLTTGRVRAAQYSVLEAALPGRPQTPVGVLLLDPETDTPYIRLRDDFREIADPEDAEVLAHLDTHLKAAARESGGDRLLQRLEDSLSNALRITDRRQIAVGDFTKALGRLYERYVEGLAREALRILPFRTHLPVYSLQAAAGKWGADQEVEPEGWIRAPEDLRLTADMFVAQVVGRSMEPRIPDGSHCVFRGGLIAGSRQGKLLLVWNRATSETGGRYTVKVYESHKVQTPEGWRHERIVLKPLNPEYEAWELDPSELESGRYLVIGEFLRVLPFEDLYY